VSDNHIRNYQVSEIISSNPSFLVRNGISLFVLILIIIIAVCSFVKYPDVISTNAKLTAINPPKEIKAKVNGRLVELFATENQKVQEGTILGYLESTANHKYIINLSNIIDTMVQLMQQNKVLQTILDYKTFLSKNKTDENYGEIQAAYQTFIQAYNSYNQYLNGGFYLQKLSMLQKDISYLQRLKESLLQQKKMTEEDVKLMQENFAAQEKMNKEKVIAPVEYRNEKSKLIAKEISLPQINSIIINNDNSQHTKQKEIAELQNQIAQQQNIFIQALQSFKAIVDDWKAKYLFTTPVAGTIEFAGFVQSNQLLQVNQILCFVNPKNSAFYAQLLIPQTNLGKIKVNQKVLLKLPSYPFQQYGYIEGTLNFISNIPTDSGYIAKVDFTRGLQTNYSKSIFFREGLKANAEIITEDLSLLERFFYNIRTSFKISN